MELSLYDSTYKLEDTHWWFAGRRAIVFDALRRQIDVTSGLPRILDLGCGTGRNLAELETLSWPVGLDIERRALAWSRKRGVSFLVQGGAEQLPFRTASFDTVTALDLLEHILDDVGGAREVHRVLRPGGSFIAFVPAYNWLWGPQDDVSHHLRRYDPDRLTHVLEQAGFRITRLSHVNLLLLPLILVGRRLLRVTHKQVETEGTLNPGFLNGVLKAVFLSERYVLRAKTLPLGVSLICVATKRATGKASPRQIRDDLSLAAAAPH